jgi:hypothetical protein
MKWDNVLEKWEKGIFSYPKNIKKRFFYETSFIITGGEKYNYKFIEDNKLQLLKQDYSPFIQYINKSKNKYVTSFMNLTKDTMLIIPTPRKNKNFTTIKDFIDNASILQQKKYWKYVSNIIKKLTKNNKYKYYISTHGLGVYYFHLRISKIPKYYHTQSFF